MKVYIATCQTNDPEQNSVMGEYDTTILGVFTDKNTAKLSFIKEKDNGTWVQKHICFQGHHAVTEVEVDKWTPLGIDIG
jgi:hypothetical protein